MWLVVVVAALLSGAATVLATVWLSGAVAAGAAAVVATLAGVWAGRGTDALNRRNATTRWPWACTRPRLLSRAHI